MKDDFYVLYFFWNQEQIAQEHCENKDREELQCNGKCHLAKTLKAQKTEKKSLPKEFLESISEMNVLKPKFGRFFLAPIEIDTQYRETNLQIQDTHKGFPISVFHPPLV